MGRQVVSLARRQEGKAVACPPDDALNQQVAQGAVDRLAQEKRKLLETIESEIIEAHRRMDRLFELLETFVVDIAIAVVRITPTLGGRGASRNRQRRSRRFSRNTSWSETRERPSRPKHWI